MCIFLFWSADAIFSNLMKSTWKIKNSKKVEINFLTALILLIIFFL